MRMDDAVSIGRLEVAFKLRSDLDTATRILCHLTSEGSDRGAPAQSDASSRNGRFLEVDMWF